MKKTTAFIVIAVLVAGILLFFPPWEKADNGRNSVSNWTCNSRNTVDSSSRLTFSSCGFQRLAARNIAVLCESDHPLLTSAADMLVQELSKLPFVDKVHYSREKWDESYPTGPGLFIRIQPEYIDIKRDGSQVIISAWVKLDVDEDPFYSVSHSHIHTDVTPPTVSWYYNGTIHHESTNKGSGPPGSEFDAPAKSLGEQMSEQIIGNMKKAVKEHGACPAALIGFYGNKSGQEVASTIKKAGFSLITSSRPMCRHFADYYTIDADNATDAIEKLQTMLKEAGFDGNVRLPEDEHFNNQFTRGDEWVDIRTDKYEIYSKPTSPEDWEKHGISYEELKDALRNEGIDVSQMNRPTATSCLHITVRHVLWMSRDSVMTAIDNLFKSADMETLAMFYENMTDQQKDSLQKMVEESDSDPVDRHFTLAKFHYKDWDKARTLVEVRKAALCMYGLWDGKYKEIRNSLEELAADAGDGSATAITFNSDLLAQVNAREIPAGTEDLVFDIELLKPVMFYCTDSSNLQLFGFHLSKEDDGTYMLRWWEDGFGIGYWHQKIEKLQNEWSDFRDIAFTRKIKGYHIRTNPQTGRIQMRLVQHEKEPVIYIYEDSDMDADSQPQDGTSQEKTP